MSRRNLLRFLTYKSLRYVSLDTGCLQRENNRHANFKSSKIGRMCYLARTKSDTALEKTETGDRHIDGLSTTPDGIHARAALSNVISGEN